MKTWSVPRGFHYAIVLDGGCSGNVVSDILVQRKGVLPPSTKPRQKIRVLVLTLAPTWYDTLGK